MKTIYLFTILILLNFSLTVNKSFGQAGSLDLTFSTDGKVNTPIGTYGDKGYAVAIQSDGKIVVAGSTVGASFNDEFGVIRYNTDGTLDVTFDSDGKVNTSIASGGSVAKAVAIQSDGKIVVAGYTSNGTNNDFALVRYNSNGSLDNTFGTGGMVYTPIGTLADVVNSIAIQSDGKIVVVGQTNVASTAHFSIARYNTNGTLDTSFDSDGFAITTSTFGGANGVAIQTDGKIIAVGGYNTEILRYTTTGALDLTFSGDGIMNTTGFGFEPYSVALQTNGKIVLGGSVNNDFTVGRLNTNGAVDNTFGTSGKTTTPIGTADDFVYGLALQSDGKIVLAGYTDNGSENDFALARYTTTGILDTEFDSDGILTTAMDVSSEDVGTAIAIQPSDGKIVVVGHSTLVTQADFSVARYIGICPLPSTPGTITGNTTACINSSNTYSIATVGGATSYTWSVPSGAVINSGQGTTSINVTFGTTSGNIIVIANNTCGSSSSQTLAVSLQTLLSAPGTISGNTSYCSGDNHSYSISSVAGATGYTWSVPAGAVINSGQGTTGINVTFGASSGNITVTANNICGSSTPQTLAVSNSAPSQPGSITGPTSFCFGTTQTFSIASVSGASSYTWFVPGDATINSGQGTTTISVTFGNTSGTVSVTSDNTCGSSNASSLGVTVNNSPATPGAITGDFTVCPSSVGNVYSISSVSLATSYTWLVPSDAVITSGQGTTSITVTFGTSSGFITVYASNGCGDSGWQFTPMSVQTPNSFFNWSATNLAVTFTNLSTETTTYAWVFGDAGTSAATNPVHNYAAAGTYTVELTATGPCGSDLYTTNITISASGNAGDVSVNEIENDLLLNSYPNPTSGVFQLVVGDGAIQTNDKYTVEVFNLTGECVRSINLDTGNAEINLKDCANGIYFLKCSSQRGSGMIKIIKE